MQQDLQWNGLMAPKKSLSTHSKQIAVKELYIAPPIIGASDNSRKVSTLSREQELELAQLVVNCYKQWKQQ